jgi:hypothetical protein
MQKIILFIIAFLIQYSSQAQLTIYGKVVDEKGTPLPSVNITSGKSAAVSNADGGFSFATKKLPTILTIQSIGFESKKITIDSTNYKLVTIVLNPKYNSLEEVVVVGYAIKRKREVAYSTETVSSSEVSVRGATSIDARLAGKVSGIAISSVDKEFGKTDYRETKKANPYHAKLLTASEVDDFKKWNLWNNYNEADFTSFVNQYTIKYTKRYSILLVNEDNVPLINQTVHLQVKKTGKLLWEAKTDNTGKAELWLTNDSITSKEKLVVTVNGQKEYPVFGFEQGVNIIKYNQACGVADKVDIAFIVDATGSMGDEINYLKAELGDILGQLKTKHSTTDFSIASVFYRDYNDQYVTKITPFSNNINTITNFIQEQAADGGGDYPEALVSALHRGIDDLQWRDDAKARIAFLVLDAPPHDREMQEYKTLIQQYAAKGIRVIPIVCSGAEKSVEFLMRSFALATNGIYTFLTDDSGIGDKHIKPTTDEFKVQLLNQLMISLIDQMIYTRPCEIDKKAKKIANPFTTSINDVLKVSVFPNPTRNTCTLESNEPLKEIFIADFTGKLLQKLNVTNDDENTITIDLSKYPSGTYIIKYITEDDITGTCKVVKL